MVTVNVFTVKERIFVFTERLQDCKVSKYSMKMKNTFSKTQDFPRRGFEPQVHAQKMHNAHIFNDIVIVNTCILQA